MNKKKSIQADRRSLRKRAEDQLSSDRVTDVSNMSTEEVKKLVLELETHQIELKMQNEELRLAHEELYDSHAEYVQLYDFAPVGYLTINHKNIITHINLTMAALLGKQRARIINNPLSSYIFNEDQDTYYLNIKKTKETQNKQHCELRLVTKDNDTIWVHLDFQPDDTHEGREKVILIAVIDITKRKQVDYTLRHLNQAINTSGEAIFMTDLDGIITYINSAFSEIYGYTANEVVGKVTPRILKSGVMNPEEYSQFWDALLRGEKITTEIINKAKDGRLITMDISANPIFDEKNKLIGFLSIQKNISDKKQSMEAFNEKSMMLDNILNNSIDMAIATTDLDFRITYYNPLAEKYFGYSGGEVIGKTVQEMHTKEKVASHRFDQAIQKVKQTGEYIFFVNQETPEGIRYLKSRVSGIINAEGKINGFAQFTLDITEQKIFEEEIKTINRELENSMALADSIYNAIPDAIVTVDTDRKIVSINKSFQKILGYSQAEILGRTTAYFYESEAEFERMGKLRYNMTAEEQAEPYEVNYRRKNGEVFPGETLGVPILNKLDERIGFIGVIRDITDRKQAEEAQRKSEEIFKTLTVSSPNGIYMTDLDGKCVYVNDKWCEMAGISFEEAMGDGWMNGIHPDDREKLISNWKKFVKKEVSWGFDYRFYDSMGNTTWVNGIVEELKDEW